MNQLIDVLAKPARPYSSISAPAIRRPGRGRASGAHVAAAGEDPNREGLMETPARVVRAYAEWFAGYAQDPTEFLHRTFSEVAGYDEMVVVRDIEFSSHCEHHLASIKGRAHIGYLPRSRVVGLSKLARVVEIFAHRLQIQERMTAQIADAIQTALEPRGVAVVIEGSHACMASRGVRKPGAGMVTSRMLGVFRENPATRHEFLAAIGRLGASMAS